MLISGCALSSNEDDDDVLFVWQQPRSEIRLFASAGNGRQERHLAVRVRPRGSNCKIMLSPVCLCLFLEEWMSARVGR